MRLPCQKEGSTSGDVYEAEHLLLRRACAIKVIKPDRAGDSDMLRRFEREVRATASLTHWNTIAIYDYGHSSDGRFYYVMEYLRGMSLQELVDSAGSVPEARVIHILVQTCDALVEAHAHGMVHRDIKPANIYLAELGGRFDVVKLLDFGLVRPLIAGTGDLAITQQNLILGSPLYMPPEQAAGEPPDVRSDIYALGAVAYFLLCGKPPFEGDNPMEVILAHARRDPPPLDRNVVSPEMRMVVERCLAKEAENRFQTVAELRGAMEQCSGAGSWNWEFAANWWRSSAER